MLPNHPMSTSVQSHAMACASHGWTNPDAARALDLGLNAAIIHIANRLGGYDVAEVAPDTLDKLCAHMDRTGRMLVWSGASDATIFGDPEVNYAFRAWHDWHHWKHKLPFTPEGEREAWRHQCRDLVRLYGRSPKVAQWCRILQAEIIGQLAHCEIHGAFPTDQAAFVRAYLVDRNDALMHRH